MTATNTRGCIFKKACKITSPVSHDLLGYKFHGNIKGTLKD
jgi:hypothetical protein